MENCFFCSDEYKSYYKFVCELPHAFVYLTNEQEYPGRCAVVTKVHRTELFEMEPEELSGFMCDVARTAKAISTAFKAEKINYAVYGDIDRHVHFHVVPKHSHSKNWGSPFELGGEEGKEKFLTEWEYEETIAKIREHL